MGTPKYTQWTDPNDPSKGTYETRLGSVPALDPQQPPSSTGYTAGPPVLAVPGRSDGPPDSGGGTGGTARATQRPAPFSRRRLANDAAGMATAPGTSLLTRRRR
jgi:hypothetical protein